MYEGYVSYSAVSDIFLGSIYKFEYILRICSTNYGFYSKYFLKSDLVYVLLLSDI